MCRLFTKPETCRLSRFFRFVAVRSLQLTVVCGSGCGVFRNGVPQGSQRRRNMRETGLATERPCPGAAHSTHPSRAPWSDQCGARDQSTGRSDDSSPGILELTTPCKGASPSSLWSFPNFAKSHRVGCRSPRRGEIRRFRTVARNVVPFIRDSNLERRTTATIWCRVAAARTVRPRRSTL